MSVYNINKFLNRVAQKVNASLPFINDNCLKSIFKGAMHFPDEFYIIRNVVCLKIYALCIKVANEFGYITVSIGGN